jgi:hypothetical protein
VAAGPVILANIFGHSPLMDGQAERFGPAARALLYLPFLAGAALAIADCWRLPRS